MRVVAPSTVLSPLVGRVATTFAALPAAGGPCLWHGSESARFGWRRKGFPAAPGTRFASRASKAKITHGSPYSKELGLLNYVLENASAGEPESVCAAVERYGEEVLSPLGLWLKVAGGSKAAVLADAVKRSPRGGSILEIGTYCGYSAIQMSLALPKVRIVTLEVDPAHVVIARNIVAFAGLAHLIDVWTGHSKDLLLRLPHRYGGEGHLKFRAVFMDQRGSRYDEDLATLERGGLLRPGAVIVADNVLKPGAPLFLWRLARGGAYDTDLVTLKEFAMPSEDWMSVSVRRPEADAVEAASAASGVPAKEPPPELVQLQWESDRMRAQATRKGQGVTYQEWAAFARHMKEGMARYDIKSTKDAADVPALEHLTAAAGIGNSAASGAVVSTKSSAL